jgi:hypothetical protein
MREQDEDESIGSASDQGYLGVSCPVDASMEEEEPMQVRGGGNKVSEANDMGTKMMQGNFICYADDLSVPLHQDSGTRRCFTILSSTKIVDWHTVLLVTQAGLEGVGWGTHVTSDKVTYAISGTVTARQFSRKLQRSCNSSDVWLSPFPMVLSWRSPPSVGSRKLGSITWLPPVLSSSRHGGRYRQSWHLAKHHLTRLSTLPRSGPIPC